MSETVGIILNELTGLSEKIDENQLLDLCEKIQSAKRIFVAGAGRSGFAARGFSNRLMHLGFQVYFVGEPTTPAVHKDDLLIICSGSGKTTSLVKIAEKAKEQQTKMATITIDSTGTIGLLADTRIIIPGNTRLLNDENRAIHSVQPLGSIFEQLSWITFDAIILLLLQQTNQSFTDLINRHANLE